MSSNPLTLCSIRGMLFKTSLPAKLKMETSQPWKIKNAGKRASMWPRDAERKKNTRRIMKVFLFLHPEFQGSCKFANYTTGKQLTGSGKYWHFSSKIIIFGLLQRILKDTVNIQRPIYSCTFFVCSFSLACNLTIMFIVLADTISQSD